VHRPAVSRVRNFRNIRMEKARDFSDSEDDLTEIWGRNWRTKVKLLSYRANAKGGA